MASSWLKLASSWLKLASSWLKLVSSWPQVGSSWPQVGLKLAQDGLMLAPNGVKNRSIKIWKNITFRIALKSIFDRFWPPRWPPRGGQNFHFWGLETILEPSWPPDPPRGLPRCSQHPLREPRGPIWEPFWWILAWFLTRFFCCNKYLTRHRMYTCNQGILPNKEKMNWKLQ